MKNLILLAVLLCFSAVATAQTPTRVNITNMLQKAAGANYTIKTNSSGEQTYVGLDALFSAGTGITIVSGTISVSNLAGDVTGSPAANTVVKLQNRAVASTAPTNGQALVWNNSTTTWEPGNVGTGTVTSVALSLPSIFSVSGSPVTTSGTLTGTLATQTANTVFAAPNGSTGAPTFRALVAADIPSLAASIITSGILPIARGGTNLGTTPTNGQLLIGNGTGYTLANLTAGAGIAITNGTGSITVASTNTFNEKSYNSVASTTLDVTTDMDLLSGDVVDVIMDGVTLSEGASFDYTINYTTNVITFTFTPASQRVKVRRMKIN